MSGAIPSSSPAGAERRHAHELKRQAETAKTKGDHEAAHRGFRAALSAFSLLEDPLGSARMLAELADLHLTAGDFTAAVDLRRQQLERSPDDVDALIGLGYAQWLGGSPADGEVTFSQALNRDQRAARALAGRGQIRADLGDCEDALADLDHALALGLSPGDETDVRSARALALAGAGRLAEAEREIDAALGTDPERPRSRLRAGRIAALAGRTDRARDELRQALRSSPATGPLVAKTARRVLAALES